MMSVAVLGCWHCAMSSTLQAQQMRCCMAWKSCRLSLTLYTASNGSTCCKHTLRKASSPTAATPISCFVSFAVSRMACCRAAAQALPQTVPMDVPSFSAEKHKQTNHGLPLPNYQTAYEPHLYNTYTTRTPAI